MMDNAVIAYNGAESYGGGVFISNGGTKTITITDNAVIRNNAATGRLGGGVYRGGSSQSTIAEGAGRIFNNTAGQGYANIYP
jgi:hypothetical protein